MSIERSSGKLDISLCPFYGYYGAYYEACEES